MNKQHVIVFLGAMSEENDDGLMKTVSTITVYISAGKWGYRSSNIFYLRYFYVWISLSEHKTFKIYNGL